MSRANGKETACLCPACGRCMEHIYEGIFDNSWVCRNHDCKGWFCSACDEWHPYGTTCAVAMVRAIRRGTK
jgi:hypothetical protein